MVNQMEGFTVGGTVVGGALINEKIAEEIKKEDELLKPVQEVVIKRSPEQESAIAEVKKAINITDESLVLGYGVAESKGLMELSNKTLGHVRAADIGEVGSLLGDLTTQLAVRDKDEDAKGIFGIFKKGVNRAKALQIQYESAQDNIDRVVGMLESNQLTLMKNNRDLEDMKAANHENFKRLSVYVEAGKLRIQEAQEVELPKLIAAAEAGGQSEINQLTEFRNALSLFEKQVHDLDAQMSLSQAMAIQLETISNTNRGLIQKINRSQNVLIPAWHMYMMTAFYGDQTKKAAEVDELVTNATNTLLVEVTKDLREAALKGVELSERASISLETLETMNSEIIASLKDIDAAQAKGRENRRNATARIEEMREELRTQLLTTVSNSKG